MLALLLLLAGCQSRGEMERELRQELLQLRSVIDDYNYKNQHGPQSLQELVQAGYLREIPVDSCTGKRDWRTIPCEHYKAIPDHTTPGICDVKSACRKKAKDGTPYSTW